MRWISENNYETDMNEIVVPFLKEHGIEGELPLKDKPGWMSDGTPVYTCTFQPSEEAGFHYEVYRPEGAPTGSIVISHGLSESTLKYREMIFYFLLSGYQVFIMDHRGHGHSLRETDKPWMIHIRHFDDYVTDLHYFVNAVVKPRSQGLPLILYGHSMGGWSSAVYAQTWPNEFYKVVLSSPMLKIQTGGIPVPAGRALSAVMKLVGRGGAAMKGAPTNLDGENFEGSAGVSRARFDYYLKLRKADPALLTISTSFSWLGGALAGTKKVTAPKNCHKIKSPVLLLTAGADTLVDPAGAEQFAKEVRRIETFCFEGAKHELYNQKDPELQQYLFRILSFIQ